MGWFDQPGGLLAAFASACAALGLAVLLFMGSSQEAQASQPSEAGQAVMPQAPASPPAFMRLNNPQAFVCRAHSDGFRQAELVEAAAYVAEYQRYVSQLRQAPLPDGAAADYSAQARQALLRALEDALQWAQMPPGTAELGSRESPVATEQALARRSAELKQAMATLPGVLRSYREFGEPKKVAALERCVRDFALKGLGETEALMHASRLYLPTVARSREQMFVLGSERVLKDFLARQRGRAQMLVAYAEPFLSLLSASSGEVMDVSVQVLADFWQNSILELQRDLQSREPEGQVAALEAYFIHVLDKLDYRQCARQFAAYASPEPGNDLFSQYRYQLASMAELRCKDYRQSVVRGMYAALAGRFNRELAGRYPFAGADALDASPATVRAFLLDYAAQRRSLEEYLDALPEPRHKLTDFVRELDAVAAFFRSNLSAGEVAQPFRLQLAFNLQRRDSSGADQVLAWGLRNDSLMAGWPNRATTLDWHVGEHLTLDLGWAPQSRWAPMADPQQVDMQVEGRRASFALQSPWALLRMIERHAMSDPRSAASEELLLGFSVPLQGAAEAAQPARSQARLYLGVTLLETSPKTRAEVPLRLPERFPWSAPVL